jgi:hypothetical protein
MDDGPGSIDGLGDSPVAVHAELNRGSGGDKDNRYGDGGDTQRRQKGDQPK